MLFFLVFVVSGCLFHSGPQYLSTAEDYEAAGEFDKAIEAYRRHMAYRLSLTKRPDWENPYLYLLTIGDLELKRDNPTEALARYDEARSHEVEERLVSDRYRQVAHYYEERGELQNGINVLTKYREIDSLLFDGMLDRLSKQLVREEDEAKKLAR